MAVAKGKLTIIAHVLQHARQVSSTFAMLKAGSDAIPPNNPPIYFRLPGTQWPNTGTTSITQHQIQTILSITFLSECCFDSKSLQEMLKNPRVIGVKNSSMPVQDIQTFVSLGAEDHIVFNGPDEQFLGRRLMGAKAGIGGIWCYARSS